ncbi:MAG: tRNA lysidine(34) synthetase TilS, partial [Cytophagales bacterium]|nr:tRNA lysidine(34) synthetase TilS [Cytophagales bacterium]
DMGENRFSISIDILQSFAAPAVILYEIINEMGFSYADCVSICSVIGVSESKHFYSATHELIKERERLIVNERMTEFHLAEEYFLQQDDSKVENQFFALEIQYSQYQGEIPRLETNEVWMDADKLVFPLTVRRWKEGDSFQPFGMKGRKKISDFLIDEKVPASDKNNVWVLVSEAEIVWVIGYRMSEKVKLEVRTNRVIKLVVNRM